MGDGPRLAVALQVDFSFVIGRDEQLFFLLNAGTSIGRLDNEARHLHVVESFGPSQDHAIARHGPQEFGMNGGSRQFAAGLDYLTRHDT